MTSRLTGSQYNGRKLSPNFIYIYYIHVTFEYISIKIFIFYTSKDWKHFEQFLILTRKETEESRNIKVLVIHLLAVIY